MNSKMEKNKTPESIGPLTIQVINAETVAENGRKFTKYKVLVNYRGREIEVWRRYKEFDVFNEKVFN